MSKPNRFFIGLDLPPHTKLALANWRDTHLGGIAAKPIEMENFHITLVFVGHIEPAEHERLTSALQDIDMPHVEIHTAELSVFNKPKVLYLGVTLNSALDKLQQACRACCEQSGLKIANQPYIPHISLFRKYSGPNDWATLPPDFTFKADAFHLFESVSSKIRGIGPHYPRRQHYPLSPI